MNLWSLVITSVFLIAAVVCAFADARSGYEPAPVTPVERAAWRFFGFFGVGALPPLLAVAVLLSTGAVFSAALDIIANLYFGAAYPAWFPADAAASGLGVGLLCARVLTPAPPAVPGPGAPGQGPESQLYPREAGYSF
jgi:hypothetical protein